MREEKDWKILRKIFSYENMLVMRINSSSFKIKKNELRTVR